MRLVFPSEVPSPAPEGLDSCMHPLTPDQIIRTAASPDTASVEIVEHLSECTRCANAVRLARRHGLVQSDGVPDNRRGPSSVFPWWRGGTRRARPGGTDASGFRRRIQWAVGILGVAATVLLCLDLAWWRISRNDDSAAHSRGMASQPASDSGKTSVATRKQTGGTGPRTTSSGEASHSYSGLDYMGSTSPK